jgi:Cu(I)/Ag(I) efflux system membrane protein CusA/SilA
MIGGMTSSTILTLVVIPAIYGLIKGWRLPIVAGAISHDAKAEPPPLLRAAE